MVDLKKDQKKSKVTLSQRGAKLPVGTTSSLNTPGALDMVVKPWRFKEEKELGRLKTDNPGTNMAEWVSIVLAHMYEKLGRHNFAQMDLAERRLAIGQMLMGDVFYAYCWLRYKSLGKILTVAPTCGICGTKFELDGDMETIDVHCAETIEDAMWEYELQVPIEINGEKVEKFVMGPSIWNSLEMINSGTNVDQGTAKSAIISGSIYFLDENKDRAIVSDVDLDEMAKIDIEALTSKIDSEVIGPNMSIDDKCPKCRSELKLPIRWEYDNFFGISSR